MNLVKILGYIDFAVFWSLMLFVKADKNRLFVKYILLSFLFLHVRVIPEFTLFDTTVFIYFFLFYKKKPQTALDINLYAVLLGGYLVAIFFGLLKAEVGAGLNNYIEIIKIFPVFIFSRILIDECIADREFLEEVVKGCRMILLMALVFLGIQMVLGVDFRLVPTLNPNVVIVDAIRYPGIFSDPQQFSQFLGVFSYLSIMHVSKEVMMKRRNYLLVVGAIIGILAAGGRAGLLGWMIGFALLLLFSKPKVKIGILAIGLVIGLLALSLQDRLSIFKRSSDLQETYDFRESIWAEAIQISADHPLFGIGLDNYQKYVSIYNPNQVWEMHEVLESFDQPESGYLKILTEVGGIGFLSLMLMMLVPIIKSFFNYFRQKDLNFILLIGAFIAWGVGFYSTYSLNEIRIRFFVALVVSFMIIQNHYIRTQSSESSEEEEEEDEEDPEYNNHHKPSLAN